MGPATVPCRSDLAALAAIPARLFVGVPKSDLHKIMADDEAEMFGVSLN